MTGGVGKCRCLIKLQKMRIPNGAIQMRWACKILQTENEAWCNAVVSTRAELEASMWL